MNILGISALYHDSAAVLLQEGRIVESGTHSDLLKLKGIEAASDAEWDDIRAMNLHLLDSLLSSAP